MYRLSLTSNRKKHSHCDLHSSLEGNQRFTRSFNAIRRSAIRWCCICCSQFSDPLSIEQTTWSQTLSTLFQQSLNATSPSTVTTDLCKADTVRCNQVSTCISGCAIWHISHPLRSRSGSAPPNFRTHEFLDESIEIKRSTDYTTSAESSDTRPLAFVEPSSPKTRKVCCISLNSKTLWKSKSVSESLPLPSNSQYLVNEVTTPVQMLSSEHTFMEASFSKKANVLSCEASLDATFDNLKNNTVVFRDEKSLLKKTVWHGQEALEKPFKVKQLVRHLSSTPSENFVELDSTTLIREHQQAEVPESNQSFVCVKQNVSFISTSSETISESLSVTDDVTQVLNTHVCIPAGSLSVDNGGTSPCPESAGVVVQVYRQTVESSTNEKGICIGYSTKQSVDGMVSPILSNLISNTSVENVNINDREFPLAGFRESSQKNSQIAGLAQSFKKCTESPMATCPIRSHHDILDFCAEDRSSSSSVGDASNLQSECLVSTNNVSFKHSLSVEKVHSGLAPKKPSIGVRELKCGDMLMIETKTDEEECEGPKSVISGNHEEILRSSTLQNLHIHHESLAEQTQADNSSDSQKNASGARRQLETPREAISRTGDIEKWAKEKEKQRRRSFSIGTAEFPRSKTKFRECSYLPYSGENETQCKFKLVNEGSKLPSLTKLGQIGQDSHHLLRNLVTVRPHMPLELESLNGFPAAVKVLPMEERETHFSHAGSSSSRSKSLTNRWHRLEVESTPNFTLTDAANNMVGPPKFEEEYLSPNTPDSLSPIHSPTGCEDSNKASMSRFPVGSDLFAKHVSSLNLLTGTAAEEDASEQINLAYVQSSLKTSLSPNEIFQNECSNGDTSVIGMHRRMKVAMDNLNVNDTKQIYNQGGVPITGDEPTQKTQVKHYSTDQLVKPRQLWSKPKEIVANKLRSKHRTSCAKNDSSIIPTPSSRVARLEVETTHLSLESTHCRSDNMCQESLGGNNFSPSYSQPQAILCQSGNLPTRQESHTICQLKTDLQARLESKLAASEICKMGNVEPGNTGFGSLGNDDLTTEIRNPLEEHLKAHYPADENNGIGHLASNLNQLAQNATGNNQSLNECKPELGLLASPNKYRHSSLNVKASDENERDFVELTVGSTLPGAFNGSYSNLNPVDISKQHECVGGTENAEFLIGTRRGKCPSPNVLSKDDAKSSLLSKGIIFEKNGEASILRPISPNPEGSSSSMVSNVYGKRKTTLNTREEHSRRAVSFLETKDACEVINEMVCCSDSFKDCEKVSHINSSQQTGKRPHEVIPIETVTAEMSDRLLSNEPMSYGEQILLSAIQQYPTDSQNIGKPLSRETLAASFFNASKDAQELLKKSELKCQFDVGSENRIASVGDLRTPEEIESRQPCPTTAIRIRKGKSEGISSLSPRAEIDRIKQNVRSISRLEECPAEERSDKDYCSERDPPPEHVESDLITNVSSISSSSRADFCQLPSHSSKVTNASWFKILLPSGPVGSSIESVNMRPLCFSRTSAGSKSQLQLFALRSSLCSFSTELWNPDEIDGHSRSTSANTRASSIESDDIVMTKETSNELLCSQPFDESFEQRNELCECFDGVGPQKNRMWHSLPQISIIDKNLTSERSGPNHLQHGCLKRILRNQSKAKSLYASQLILSKRGKPSIAEASEQRPWRKRVLGSSEKQTSSTLPSQSSGDVTFGCSESTDDGSHLVSKIQNSLFNLNETYSSRSHVNSLCRFDGTVSPTGVFNCTFSGDIVMHSKEDEAVQAGWKESAFSQFLIKVTEKLTTLPRDDIDRITEIDLSLEAVQCLLREYANVNCNRQLQFPTLSTLLHDLQNTRLVSASTGKLSFQRTYGQLRKLEAELFAYFARQEYESHCQVNLRHCLLSKRLSPVAARMLVLNIQELLSSPTEINAALKKSLHHLIQRMDTFTVQGGTSSSWDPFELTADDVNILLELIALTNVPIFDPISTPPMNFCEGEAPLIRASLRMARVVICLREIAQSHEFIPDIHGLVLKETEELLMASKDTLCPSASYFAKYISPEDKSLLLTIVHAVTEYSNGLSSFKLCEKMTDDLLGLTDRFGHLALQCAKFHISRALYLVKNRFKLKSKTSTRICVIESSGRQLLSDAITLVLSGNCLSSSENLRLADFKLEGSDSTSSIELDAESASFLEHVLTIALDVNSSDTGFASVQIETPDGSLAGVANRSEEDVLGNHLGSTPVESTINIENFFTSNFSPAAQMRPHSCSSEFEDPRIENYDKPSENVPQTIDEHPIQTTKSITMEYTPVCTALSQSELISSQVSLDPSVPSCESDLMFKLLGDALLLRDTLVFLQRSSGKLFTKKLAPFQIIQLCECVRKLSSVAPMVDDSKLIENLSTDANLNMPIKLQRKTLTRIQDFHSRVFSPIITSSLKKFTSSYSLLKHSIDTKSKQSISSEKIFNLSEICCAVLFNHIDSLSVSFLHTLQARCMSSNGTIPVTPNELNFLESLASSTLKQLQAFDHDSYIPVEHDKLGSDLLILYKLRSLADSPEFISEHAQKKLLWRHAFAVFFFHHPEKVTQKVFAEAAFHGIIYESENWSSSLKEAFRAEINSLIELAERRHIPKSVQLTTWLSGKSHSSKFNEDIFSCLKTALFASILSDHRFDEVRIAKILMQNEVSCSFECQPKFVHSEIEFVKDVLSKPTLRSKSISRRQKTIYEWTNLCEQCIATCEDYLVSSEFSKIIELTQLPVSPWGLSAKARLLQTMLLETSNNRFTASIFPVNRKFLFDLIDFTTECAKGTESGRVNGLLTQYDSVSGRSTADANEIPSESDNAEDSLNVFMETPYALPFASVSLRSLKSKLSARQTDPVSLSGLAYILSIFQNNLSHDDPYYRSISLLNGNLKAVLSKADDAKITREDWYTLQTLQPALDSTLYSQFVCTVSHCASNCNEPTKVAERDLRFIIFSAPLLPLDHDILFSALALAGLLESQRSIDSERNLYNDIFIKMATHLSVHRSSCARGDLQRLTACLVPNHSEEFGLVSLVCCMSAAKNCSDRLILTEEIELNVLTSGILWAYGLKKQGHGYFHLVKKLQSCIAMHKPETVSDSIIAKLFIAAPTLSFDATFSRVSEIQSNEKRTNATFVLFQALFISEVLFSCVNPQTRLKLSQLYTICHALAVCLQSNFFQNKLVGRVGIAYALSVAEKACESQLEIIVSDLSISPVFTSEYVQPCLISARSDLVEEVRSQLAPIILDLDQSSSNSPAPQLIKHGLQLLLTGTFPLSPSDARAATEFLLEMSQNIELVPSQKVCSLFSNIFSGETGPLQTKASDYIPNLTTLSANTDLSVWAETAVSMLGYLAAREELNRSEDVDLFIQAIVWLSAAAHSTPPHPPRLQTLDVCHAVVEAVVMNKKPFLDSVTSDLSSETIVSSPTDSFVSMSTGSWANFPCLNSRNSPSAIAIASTGGESDLFLSFDSNNVNTIPQDEGTPVPTESLSPVRTKLIFSKLLRNLDEECATIMALLDVHHATRLLICITSSRKERVERINKALNVCKWPEHSEDPLRRAINQLDIPRNANLLKNFIQACKKHLQNVLVPFIIDEVHTKILDKTQKSMLLRLIQGYFSLNLPCGINIPIAAQRFLSLRIKNTLEVLQDADLRAIVTDLLRDKSELDLWQKQALSVCALLAALKCSENLPLTLVDQITLAYSKDCPQALRAELCDCIFLGKAWPISGCTVFTNELRKLVSELRQQLAVESVGNMIKALNAPISIVAQNMATILATYDGDLEEPLLQELRDCKLVADNSLESSLREELLGTPIFGSSEKSAADYLPTLLPLVSSRPPDSFVNLSIQSAIDLARFLRGTSQEIGISALLLNDDKLAEIRSRLFLMVAASLASGGDRNARFELPGIFLNTPFILAVLTGFRLESSNQTDVENSLTQSSGTYKCNLDDSSQNTRIYRPHPENEFPCVNGKSWLSPLSLTVDADLAQTESIVHSCANKGEHATLSTAGTDFEPYRSHTSHTFLQKSRRSKTPDGSTWSQTSPRLKRAFNQLHRKRLPSCHSLSLSNHSRWGARRTCDIPFITPRSLRSLPIGAAKSGSSLFTVSDLSLSTTGSRTPRSRLMELIEIRRAVVAGSMSELNILGYGSASVHTPNMQQSPMRRYSPTGDYHRNRVNMEVGEASANPDSQAIDLTLLRRRYMENTLFLLKRSEYEEQETETCLRTVESNLRAFKDVFENSR